MYAIKKAISVTVQGCVNMLMVTRLHCWLGDSHQQRERLPAERLPLDGIAVSLFGWSKQMQYKSSPDRVSDGKIKITTLILRRGALSSTKEQCRRNWNTNITTLSNTVTNQLASYPQLPLPIFTINWSIVASLIIGSSLVIGSFSNFPVSL